MGKLILCTGKTAGKPYIFKATGTKIYTMEELCYYIYHNVETISEDLFRLELIDFIRNELGLTERADYLEDLVKKRVGIKDLVVSIFCSADYYDKNEINHLLTEIDVLYRMNPAQRKKRQADYCMRYGQWKEAMRQYRNILNGKEFMELTGEEYGDILHNIGVLEARNGAFLVASDKFREAYERNHREESLKQYLYALKASEHQENFEREVRMYVGTRELLASIEEELFRMQESSEYTSMNAEVKHLEELKEKGKMQEYYEQVDHLLKRIKDKYRLNSL
ncbi:MAG: hypothetical protein PUC65_17020 [Clostridiales bacterium]|nr:hypothetical protein [Clostridiales bacterium]